MNYYNYITVYSKSMLEQNEEVAYWIKNIPYSNKSKVIALFGKDPDAIITFHTIKR